MTKNELIRRAHEALARVAALPPKEQIRRLVEFGTIDEQGRVLMGRDEEAAPEAEAQADKAAPRVEKAP
ncbi:MAG: hypothetical protein K2W96_04305 [Gemmataceae bacterium]|nr:hypothetical protein [Gemmataceae bacterium]